MTRRERCRVPPPHRREHAVNGVHCVSAQSTLVLESGGDEEDEEDEDGEDQEGDQEVEDQDEARREDAAADDEANALVRVSAQTPPMAQ